MQLLRRVIVASAVTGFLAWSARWLVPRLRALRSVSADLRTPALLLPIAPATDRRVRMVRTALRRMPPPAGAGLVVRELFAEQADGPPVRVVTVERKNRADRSAGLVWIHGGGTVIGVPEQAGSLCARFVDELDVVVACPDYRLAPEHPFPAALDDCYATLCWLDAHADELGVDGHRIAIGGDSAGGLLAASLAQLARDRGGPSISFQLLEYPMLDDRTVLRGPVGHDRSFVWSPEANRYGWTSYLGHPPTAGDERAYAAPARTEDLSGLPPAWIGVGDLDLLRDEAAAYAERLSGAGVPCELHLVSGMYHGADSIRPQAMTARAFRDSMASALVEHLSVTAASD